MMADVLDQARGAYERRSWDDAYRGLAQADERAPLAPEDLDLLATAAYLTGRVDAAAEDWERTHRAFVESGEVPRAVRCAFWLGMTLVQRGEQARGGGWLARGASLLDQAELDCVEQGYLRLPAGLQALGAGDPEAALAEFDQIARIADRFEDPDLQALGRLGRGQALVTAGDTAGGALMLDEAMLAVVSGDVSPMAAGTVYCAVILACQAIFDLRRAAEWTEALTRWCAGQPGLQPYRGQCLVHRSQIMQLQGDWNEALDEVRRACEHLSDPPGDPVLGMALYQQAELLRVRGEFKRAEEGYRRADSCGHPAQPGLALLRLAQGRVDDAMASMRRVMAETAGAVERARVLAAFVEVALAAGDVEAARTATEELATLAGSFDTPYLRAVVDYARGSVLLLAERNALAAAAVLRRSRASWQELDAPFEVARTRLRMAQACTQLGDHDTARMERDAAREVFERLGATPALAETDELTVDETPGSAVELTPRESEVLRLLATGATNKQIADALGISDKTVARHVANVFTKLAVSTRSAATAFAYRHDLV